MTVLAIVGAFFFGGVCYLLGVFVGWHKGYDQRGTEEVKRLT